MARIVLPQHESAGVSSIVTSIPLARKFSIRLKNRVSVLGLLMVYSVLVLVAVMGVSLNPSARLCKGYFPNKDIKMRYLRFY